MKTAYCHALYSIFGLRKHKITVWDKEFPILMICRTLCNLIQYWKQYFLDGSHCKNEMYELPFFLVSKLWLEKLTLAIILLVSVENVLQSRYATFFGQNLEFVVTSAEKYLSTAASVPLKARPSQRHFIDESMLLNYLSFWKNLKTLLKFILHFCKNKYSQHWLQYPFYMPI